MTIKNIKPILEQAYQLINKQINSSKNRFNYNLTSFIKHNFAKDFKEKTKNEIKKFKAPKQKLLFKPQINNSLFGTFASEYVSYKIKPNEYFNKIKLSSWYEFVPENIKKQIIEGKINFLIFAAITYAVIEYRAGTLTSEPKKKLLEISEDKFENNTFKNDFELFDKLITKQINKYINANNNIILNPIFGSNKAMLKADGDLIIDEKLIEIKCSIHNTIKIDYIRQLLGYYFLNKFLNKPYKLINKFIYWNPFYNTWYEFKIEINDLLNLEKVFNNCINNMKNLTFIKEMILYYKEDFDLNQKLSKTDEANIKFIKNYLSNFKNNNYFI